VDYTPDQQRNYETMIADRYEVDPSYFADKYGMPVGERRNEMFAPEPEDKKKDTDEDEDKDKDPDKNKQTNARSFFD
jgi:hypothetical protein